jgi:hypothetical protein
VGRSILSAASSSLRFAIRLKFYFARPIDQTVCDWSATND